MRPFFSSSMNRSLHILIVSHLLLFTCQTIARVDTRDDLKSIEPIDCTILSVSFMTVKSVKTMRNTFYSYKRILNRISCPLIVFARLIASLMLIAVTCSQDLDGALLLVRRDRSFFFEFHSTILKPNL